jgi:hypothetical protein
MPEIHWRVEGPKRRIHRNIRYIIANNCRKYSTISLWMLINIIVNLRGHFKVLLPARL